MKQILSALTLFSILFLAGCQQEIDPNILTTPPGGNGNNNGAGTTFQPLTTGSWWKFRDSTDGTITTMTVTTVSKTFQNISFKALRTLRGTQADTAYMAAPRPEYYYSVKGASPNTGNGFDLTFNYLNDTAAVGYNWQYTAGQGNGFSAVTDATVMAKGITVSVGGKTYTDVIHTQLELSYNLFGFITPVGVYDFYTAKGIGMIRIRAELGAGGTSMKTCSDLIEHQIL